MKGYTKNRWKKLLLLTSFICVFTSLFSNYLHHDSLLPAAIVTGNRFDNTTLGAQKAGNIVVIDKEQIKRIPAFSIDQIMRFAGGVEVQSRSSFGAQSDFSIRGSTFSQVLVLVDGARIFDPLTSHSNSYIPVALEEIERIEVIRGGASYIYGPDAIGGAINIITKTGTGKIETGKIDGSIMLGSGSYGLLNTRFGYAQDFSKVKISLGGNYVGSSGNIMSTGLRNDFSIGTYSAAMLYKINEKSRLTYRAGFNISNYNAQHYYTIAPLDSARGTQQALYNHFAFVTQKNNSTSRKIEASWQRSNGTYQFNKLVSKNIHTTDFFFIQGSETFFINSKLSINSGFQLDHKGIISNDRGNHSRNHAGVFLAAQYKLPKPKLLLEPSARIDYDERGGTFFSPNLAIYKSIKNGNIGIRGGRANRVADFTELYVGHGLQGIIGNGRNFGNPNLSVENSWNIELSFTQKIKKHIFNGSVFNRFGRKIIDYALTPGYLIENDGKLNDSFSYLHPTNISDVDFMGIELGWKVNYKIKEIHIVSQLMYVFVESTLARGIYTKYISNHARHNIQYSLNLTYKQQLDFNLGVFYKQRRKDESPAIIKASQEIFLLNAGINFWSKNRRIGLQANVENLLNNKYRDILGAQMSPRWFSLGLIFKP